MLPSMLVIVARIRKTRRHSKPSEQVLQVDTGLLTYAISGTIKQIYKSSSFLVRPKSVEYLLGKSQSVNTLLKHHSKFS